MESFRLSYSSVRESSEKILAVQRSTSSGVVFTIDRLAVRLWYAEKQIKALHFTETDHQLDVIGIEYISRIDGIAALLHIIKTNEDAPIVNSVFRIWSSTLHVLCQVTCNLFLIVTYFINVMVPYILFRTLSCCESHAAAYLLE